MKSSKIVILFGIIVLISLACSMPGISDKATITSIPVSTQSPLPATQAITEAVAPSVSMPTSQLSIANATQESSEDIVVIKDYSFKVNELSYIVGIVQNNTSDTIEWLEMSALVYDKDGKLISTEGIYPFLDKIEPGGTTPFQVSSDGWANGASYDFLVEGFEIATEPPAEGLEILNHNSFSDDYALYIVGEIKNSSNQTLSFIKIAAALYAADGSLVNTSYTYSSLGYLEPGGKSPFKIWFSDAWQNGDTYEIQVQGSPDEYAAKQVVQVTDYQITEDGGMCTVTGNVKNTGTTEITYATVVVVFYDASNNVLDTEWNFTTAESIPAGAASPFTITSYACPEYDHLEVYAGN